MLGKLIKHEFKETSKLMLPLYLVLVVITILGRIVAQSIMNSGNADSSTVMAIFNILSVFIYVVGLIVISIASYIYLIMRFYKNLFSNEGYLMHTLPVTSWQLLISKLVTAFIWFISETILIFLSIFCIFANNYVFEEISKFLNAYGGFDGLTRTFCGMGGVQTVLYFVLFLIISCLSGILLPYVSICIGQLWQKHKVAGSFLSFFGISFLLQLFSSTYTAFSMNSIDASQEVVFLMKTYNLGMLSSAVVAVAAFIGSGLLMKKKVNLD